MVDPYATRPVGPSASRLAIQSNTLSVGQKSSKTCQFAVIRRSTGIWSDTSESYYRSYTVDTFCVNRCASRTCHNRLSRMKIQDFFLHMISSEGSSLASLDKEHTGKVKPETSPCEGNQSEIHPLPRLAEERGVILGICSIELSQ
jgi:hypothetical protein